MQTAPTLPPQNNTATRKRRHHFWRRPLLTLAVLTGALGALVPAQAQLLYWDSNDATTGAGATPTGTWGTALFWSTDPLGDLATVGWTQGATAVFSAGTDASSAYTVTIAGFQTNNAIVIEEGTVSFVGGTNFLGMGTVTINSGATLVTDTSVRINSLAGSVWTLDGGTARTTNPGAAGSFIDIDSVIVLGPGGGTLTHVTPNILNIVQTTTTISGPGSMTKDGIGVQAIASACSYLGSTIVNDGELRVRGAANRLPTTTAMIVNSPGILNLNSVVPSGVGQQIGSLSGNGLVGLGSSTLVVGDANSTTFSGSIRDTANYGASGSASTGGRVSKQGAGALTLTGVNTFTGRFTNNAGTVTVDPGATWCGSICDVYINAGVVNLNNAAQTIENLVGAAAGTINLGTGHVLTTDPVSSTTFSGTLAGPGGLTKANVLSGATMRTLTLSGPNTYDGPTVVSGGKISVGSATALGSTVSGTTVASGAEILFDGAATSFTVNEPFSIAGPGAGDGGAITVMNSANVVISGPVTLTGDTTNTVSGSGTVLYNNPNSFTSLANQNLTLQGGGLSTGNGGTISGVIDLGTGNLTKQQGGRWTLSAANNYSGGTFVNAGTLRIANTTGSALGSGPVTVASGATLSGPGSFTGLLTVNGTLAPGASPGTLNTGNEIWNGGASYAWEINDTAGTQGADPGWDHVNISGTLTINATPGSKFNVNILSLTPANAAGAAANFDGSIDYLWTIATASGGISGFDPAAFNVNTNGFTNARDTTGLFVVEQNGNDIRLRFIHVPAVTVAPLDPSAMCGDLVSFTATATGSAPLSYQWRKGGSDLAGETASTLALGAVSGASAGSYTVVITNLYGSVTSAPTVLTINDVILPTITCPATINAKAPSVAGTTVTFAPTASDNCGAPTVVCTPASGSTFPYGTNSVTCAATDAAGNSNTCAFQVIVILSGSASNFVNTAVPDNNPNGLASTMTVSSPIGRLTDVNVKLHVTNGWNGDLYCYLVHDSGFSVLLNRVGRRAFDPLGYGDPGFDVTIDDDATNGDIHTNRYTLFGNHTMAIGGPLTGAWAPDARPTSPTNTLDTDGRSEFLSSFNSLNPNGDWTLFIADVEGGDESTLVSWTLELCGLVPIPTSITSQPGNQLVECSSNLTLTVTTAGTGPLTNQWYKDGVAIAGSNELSLAFTDIHPVNAGTYTFRVCNMVGWSTNIPPIIVTVQDTIAPAITACASNTTVCPDGAGQSVLPNWTSLVTATEGCSSVTVTQSPPAGTIVSSGTTTVTLYAFDSAGNASTCMADYIVLTNTAATSLTSLTLCPGSLASFSTVASGTGPLTYQWTKGGVNIANATNASFSIPAVAAGDAATYCVIVSGACPSVTNCATLDVHTLVSATALSSLSNLCPGAPATFTTTASGTGSITYQWTKNGINIPAATGASFNIPGVAASDSATYCVIVTGPCNSVTNCATLTVVTLPVITQQPADRTAPMGNGAVFSATATGTFLLYQWQSNGVNVAGASATSLAVSNVTLANHGDGYSLIVGNCAGSVTSRVAVLTVTPITGISFDFNTPGQFTNAPYNLVGNDWQLGGGGTAGVLAGMPFGPVVPFEVSTGGVGVATGGGGLDLAFNTALDQSFILTPVSYDFSLPGKVLTASIMTKIKVPTAANTRAIHMGFISATNGDDTLGSKFQLAGVNNTANMPFMSAIFQATVVNVVTPSYQLRAQWKAAPTVLTEAIPVNSPTNTLATNRWYKFTAVFSNTTAVAANTMTVSSMVQDMGADGITPGAVVLAMAPQTTNIVNLVTTNRWYFAIRGFENGGQDYWDNIYVTTQPGAVQMVAPLGNQTLAQGRNAEYRALVDGDGPYTYQWFKNGSPIAGAGNWKYRTPALKFPDDHGAEFSVTVTGPASSISSTSTVTVVATDLAVLSVGSVEGSVIGVRFSQPVDLATATAGGNYFVNGTPAYAAQVVVNDGLQQYRTNEVLITPDVPVSGAFTVTVTGVKSASGTPIGAQNSAAGQVLGLAGIDIDPQSIGVPYAAATLPGWEYSFAPGQITVNAGGHAIAGLWDGFRFTYKRVTGDFDLKARVPYQDMFRTSSKAGFDARVSLDPGSAHVGAFVNPALPGRNFAEGAARALPNQATGPWGSQTSPLFYPEAWLRFRRAGNTFLRYNSTNGVNWICDGQVQSTGAGVMIPDTLYVGLANNCDVGAVLNNANIQQYKLSQMDNYGDFAGYFMAAITNLSGPSNITVNAGSAATFTNTSQLFTNNVLYAAAGELVYLWQRFDPVSGGWTNMPTAGQTNEVLNTGALSGSDNGAMFRVILMAPGAASVTSDVAIVTVNDGTPPTVTRAFTAQQGINSIVLNFSELLDATTALNAANYTVTNGLGVVVAITSVSFQNGDPRVIVITTASPLPGGTNFVRISGVRDLGSQTIATTTVAAVQSAQATTASGPQLEGPVVMEFYPHLQNFGGVGDMVNRANYRRNFPGGEMTLPNGSPDFIMYSNVFGLHPNAFPSPGWGENYGARFYSYFKPSATAAYRFYLRADDFAELWINTNLVNSTLPSDIVIGFTTNSPALQQAWMCMDGIKTNYTLRNGANSKYLNTAAVGVNSGFYVFPAAGSTTINGMRFWAAGDSIERDPLTFELSGTASTGTNGPWTVIASGNTSLPITGGASATGRYMAGADANFANATAYRGYRVRFPTIRGPSQNSMQIGEVEFLNGGSKVLPSGATLQVQMDLNSAIFSITNSSSNAVFTAGTTLNAGQLYYMEVRFKETGGGDGASVAVRSDGTVPAITDVISNQNLVFPTAVAPVATPVKVEIYSALASVNPLTGNGGWNAAGAGSILDLLNALTLTNYIAKIPNIVGYAQHFGWNTNKLSGAATMETYLGRIYANYIAPSNGLYKFYVAVDDTAQLLMNTNAVNSTDPAGAKLLGQIINYSGTANQNLGAFRQVQGGSGVYNLLAENVSLTSNQMYYIEARWREGTGGDGIQIAVRAQTDAVTPPGAANTGGEVIRPDRLAMSSSLDRFGPIKLGGIQASVSGGPPVITNQLVVNAGDVITFNAVDVSGAGSAQGAIANATYTTTTAAGPTTFAAHPLSTMGLVWLKNGTDLAKHQLFNSQMFYVTQPVTPADNLSTISLLVSNTFSTATQTVMLVVNPDSTPPVITFANSSPYGDTVTLLFSETVDSFTAQCLANYRIPGLQIYSVQRDDVNRRRVNLRTSPQTPNTCYTVTVDRVTDMAGNATVGATATFTAWGTGGIGAVYVELFTNMVFGGLDPFLQTNPKFIYNMPDITYYTNVFSCGVGVSGGDSGLNFYAARLSGLFMPPSNGLYRFYVRGDDATQLYMNTNGPSPSGRLLVARNDSAASGAYNNGNGLGGDNSRAGASASPILSLTNGTPYWVEAHLEEGTGGDYLQVVMTAIDPGTLTDIGGVPVVAVGSALSGGFFSAPGNPDLNTLLLVSTPPVNQILAANDQVNLTVVATVLPPSLAPFASYQWQRTNSASGGFTNLPGGNVASLSGYYAELADNGAMFRFLASIPGTNLAITTTLQVDPDVTPPYIVSVGSIDGNTIGICWSERMDFATATDPFAYFVNGEYPLDPALLRPDARTVVLRLTSPLTSRNFTVEYNSIEDLAHLAGSGTVDGRTEGLIPLDLGTSGLIAAGGYSATATWFSPTNPFTCTNASLDVVANGWDFFNNADAGHFDYRAICGNFDLKVRVQKLIGADQLSKAGLMVRGSSASPTGAGSREIFIGTTPATTPIVGQAANNFYSFQYRDADGGASVNPANSLPPVHYPNAWLRMQRVGSVFNAYYGTNGSTWTLLGSRDTAANPGGAYPNSVLVGLAATSHDQTRGLNNNAVVEFRDIYLPDPPTITVQASPSNQVVAIHQAVSYTVTATNPPNAGPLLYQWRFNGVAIPGATTATFTIADTLVSHTGTYLVDVYNDGGCNPTSQVLNLIVSNALPVLVNDTICATQGLVLTFPAGNLLTNDYDPEGDPTNLIAVSGILPVSYSANFDDGLAPAGATLYGVLGGGVVAASGGVNNSGYLKLTDLVVNQAGSMVINDLTPGRRVSAFSARFMLRIGDGSAQPADGFNFSFAGNLPSAAGTGFGENGAGTGFSFCVDNYQFVPLAIGAAANAPGGGTVNTSGLKINFNNVIITGVQIPTWNSPRFVPVTIDVNAAGQCVVTVDGTNVFGTVNLPGYAPRAGRFGLYGRTGGQTETHWVDDLSVTVNTLETTRPLQPTPPPNLSGAVIFGSTYVTNGNGTANSGSLHLTDNINSQAGSFILPELTPGKAVASFTASFNLRIGNGTGNAADGFSFNLAGDLPLAAAPTFPVAGAAEEGAGTGLSMCIDNYPTGGPDSPSFKLKTNGVLAGLVLIPKWNSTAYIPVNITLAAGGLLTVNINGTNVVASLPVPGYTPVIGRFGMYARTGGENETHWVDDLAINVVAVDSTPGAYNANFDNLVLPAPTYGTVTLTNGVITYTPPSGQCGNDSYYYIVSDGQTGGTSTGRVDVVIKEASPEAPYIVSCPTNRTFVLPANQCTYVLPDYTGSLVATDNCCCLTITQDPAPGTNLPFGLHIITFTVTDTGGSNATCIATQFVNDVTAPIIACSTNISVECVGPAGTIVIYTASAMDCDPTPTLACLPASGSTFPIGLTTVTCSSSDVSGNSTNCTFTLQVVDTTPPVIAGCGTNHYYDAGLACQFALPDLRGQVIASDLCGMIAIAQSPAPGAMLGVGAHTITFTVSDPATNTASCNTVTVFIRESGAPVLTCPTAVVVKTTNLTGEIGTFAPTVTDNCDTNPTIVCNPASGSFFAMGSTTVNCTATDVSGNSNACSFVLTVNLVHNTSYAVNTPVPDNDANGLASTKTVATTMGILTDVNVRLNLSGGFNGDLYAYLVHDSGYSVLLNRVGRRTGDPAGYGDAGFDLTLDDQTTNDVHIYRFSLSGSHGVPLAGALTNSWSPDGRATDPGSVLEGDARTEFLASFNGLNPNGDWTLFVADLGPLDTSTLVSWGLNLCGLPPIPPSITTPPQSQVVHCSSNATFTVASAGTAPFTNQWYFNTSLIPGANGNTLTVTSVSVANAGSYSVVVANMAGSITSAPAMLTVIDDAPVIACPSNVVAECATPAGAMVSFPAPTVMDDCSPGIVPVCTPPSGSLFPPGLTTVNCSATDVATNVSSCSFTVRVRDTTAPTLCNDPAVVTAAGSFDNFSGSEASSPSSNLLYRLNGVVLQNFDDNRTDAWLAHTVTNLPMFASEVTLRIRVRAISGQPMDDTMVLGFVGAGGALQPPQWSRLLGDRNGVPGIYGAPWVAGTTNEFVLNLRALPNVNGSTTDLLPAIRQRGYLDIMLQDDSAVDYVVLEVKSCPCDVNILQSTINGNCGGVVNFPLPVFTDLCDPSPVVTCAPASGTFLPIGTTLVTCSAGDHSGNTNTCSFTVTIFEPAPPLTITRVGNNVVICWPATCAPKILDQTTSLNPVIAWTLVGTPPVIVGNQYCVTLPIQPGNRFFRLRSY